LDLIGFIFIFIFAFFTVFTGIFVFVFVFFAFVFAVDPFFYWLFTCTFDTADPSGGAHDAVIRCFLRRLIVIADGQSLEGLEFFLAFGFGF
jgi:hypothetical protein